MTKDEMVGWHHLLKGLEFEQTQGDSDGHRGLTCCGSWGCRVRQNLATGQQLWRTVWRFLKKLKIALP